MPHRGSSPVQRLRVRATAAAVAVVAVLAPLTLPWLGLPGPAVLLLVLLWVLGLAGANRLAVRGPGPTGIGVDPESLRLPRSRVLGGVAMAVAVAAAGAMAVQHDQLGARVQVVNDERAARALAALPPSPPAGAVEERDALEARLAGSIDADPQLTGLRADLTTTSDQLTQIQDELPCELDGTCGSLAAGAREVYEAKVRIRDDLRERQRELRSLVEGRSQVLERQRDADADRLLVVREDIRVRDRDHREAAAVIEGRRLDTGPLRRLEELWRPPTSAPTAADGYVLGYGVALLGSCLLIDLGLLAGLLRWSGHRGGMRRRRLSTRLHRAGRTA